MLKFSTSQLKIFSPWILSVKSDYDDNDNYDDVDNDDDNYSILSSLQLRSTGSRILTVRNL